jgi:hypothetical protein
MIYPFVVIVQIVLWKDYIVSSVSTTLSVPLACGIDLFTSFKHVAESYGEPKDISDP